MKYSKNSKPLTTEQTVGLSFSLDVASIKKKCEEAERGVSKTISGEIPFPKSEILSVEQKFDKDLKLPYLLTRVKKEDGRIEEHVEIIERTQTGNHPALERLIK